MSKGYVLPKVGEQIWLNYGEIFSVNGFLHTVYGIIERNVDGELEVNYFSSGLTLKSLGSEPLKGITGSIHPDGKTIDFKVQNSNKILLSKHDDIHIENNLR